MDCADLAKVMRSEDISFYSGVPDSTFKAWMSFLNDNHGHGLTNIIAANECEAVAVATGYHLATKGIPVVYMQNAGLGKTVNPLTSLADPEVYSVPMLMLIGWRGEPGVKDEPQHVKMGRITLPLLDTLEIPYEFLPDDISQAADVIHSMKLSAISRGGPAAIVIRPGIISSYQSQETIVKRFEMSREDAIREVVDALSGDAVISTTGMLSRELFEYRVSKGETPRDFLTVGSMGCCISIGLGVAMNTEKQVYVFDGDGAAIMQLGALATAGHFKPKNLKHIIFDNSVYGSTGGQPTVSQTVDFEKVALACGYDCAKTVTTRSELVSAMDDVKNSDGPYMLVVKVNQDVRRDVGRPTKSPIQNKEAFMALLRE